MPGWHRRTRDLREAGTLNTIGIVEEQHSARARLFHQWQQMEWPLLVDSSNLLGVTVVPIHLLVDRHGVIQAVARDPDQLIGFLAGDTGTPRPPPAAVVPDLEAMRAALAGEPKGDAESAETTATHARLARRLRDLGDAESLWGEATDAIEAYRRALALDPSDAKAHFRLGVVHLGRDAAVDRGVGDFAAAMAHFTRALALDPSNYIWRRRIQQYGPQLEKPYPFYDWVATATAEVRERGAVPIPLEARLTDAERVHPKGAPESVAAIPHPDPEGKLSRDTDRFVRIEAAFAPARVEEGKPVRCHVVLRPDSRRAVHWNNEVGPLQVWIELPAGWGAESVTRVASRPADQIESDEVRAVEFELTVGVGTGAIGEQVVEGYAIYPVCEGEGGTCRLLRQEFSLKIEIGAARAAKD